MPVVSDTTIQTRLNGLYKIRDDLYIHLNGGPLVNSIAQNNIGEKKKQKVLILLDDINGEIGLYEEFVKKGIYTQNTIHEFRFSITHITFYRQQTILVLRIF